MLDGFPRCRSGKASMLHQSAALDNVRPQPGYAAYIALTRQGTLGAMAVEYDFDPEDDVTSQGSSSTRFQYRTSAVHGPELLVDLPQAAGDAVPGPARGAVHGVHRLVHSAVILESVNYGPVTARKNNVGGVVGAGCR